MSFDSAFKVMTNPAPALSDASVADILRNHYGIEGVLKLLVSERDQNFVVTQASGRKHLLKIANSSEDERVSDFQTAALLHVAKADPDFPVPRVVPTADGQVHFKVAGADDTSHTVRLLSWLDGIPLRFSKKKIDNAMQLGTLLARLGIALRDFEHAASDHELLWDLKQAGRLAELLDYIQSEPLQALCRQQLQTFEEATDAALQGLRSQVIYNDLNPSNVLVDPDRPESVTGIIDFGDMVRSPLVADVAVGAAYLCKDGEELLSGVCRFLAAYHCLRPLQAAEIDILYDLILIRHVMTIVITNWRATRYPQNRDYILRNESRARVTIEQLSNMRRSGVTGMFRKACEN